MDMIFIDRDVPLPRDRQAINKPVWDNLKDYLPFDRLRVGESFAIYPSDYQTIQIKAQNYLSGAACSYRKTRTDDWNFTTRQMPDGTVRCWRIA